MGTVVEATPPTGRARSWSAIGLAEYAVSDGQDVQRFDSSLAPMSTALSVLGMPGMTAYFGLLEVGQPKPGETVFVSGAAGAVGSLVGQIAKIAGCRVVGSAGSQAKVDWLVGELGFDAAFNYKEVNDYDAKLKEICPQGVDVYFDNVGGSLTDAVFSHLNLRARVAVCGQIDQYNATRPARGPRVLWHLIVKRARVQGFLVFDFASRFPEGQQRIAEWLNSGRIKYRETRSPTVWRMRPRRSSDCFTARTRASRWCHRQGLGTKGTVARRCAPSQSPFARQRNLAARRAVT